MLPWACSTPFWLALTYPRVSWCTSIAGPASAAANMSTGRQLDATSPISATKSCPWVDAKYRTLAAAAHRGVQGKSSGGYGAMILPMCRPELFSGLATHAGDALFEHCFLPEFRQCVRALRDEYRGSFEEFWRSFRGRPPFSRESDMAMLNSWCMAACYSADADGSVRLPFDPRTGEIVPEVWERWLEWDPVRMVKNHAESLRKMRAIHVDAGSGDQWYLDLGAQAYVTELERHGVRGVHFEIFPATHSAIEYRYPLALEYLARRLA
jgi:S-formylglutathione hydrolase FrmB